MRFDKTHAEAILNGRITALIRTRTPDRQPFKPDSRQRVEFLRRGTQDDNAQSRVRQAKAGDRPVVAERVCSVTIGEQRQRLLGELSLDDYKRISVVPPPEFRDWFREEYGEWK